jgi:hypothetical protein
VSSRWKLVELEKSVFFASSEKGGSVKRPGSTSWVLLVALALPACQRHVQLKFPDTTPGEQFTCSPTDASAVKCEGAKNINPAASNQAGTVFVILPRECKGHFNEITIHDSGSSNPSVDVKCAPLENPVR